MNRTMLEGVKILDLTTTLAGPFCSMLLADLGADVIKIEEPVSGDFFRFNYEPKVSEDYSYHFFILNRNKKSVALDLKTDEGRTRALELAKNSDVLLEGFRPGVVDRLGLSYESVRSANPKIVYCSISAYGQTGPYRSRPGYDMVVKAEAGMMYASSWIGGPPLSGPPGIVDLLAGMTASNAIVSALYARLRSGLGERIDISLFDVATLCMGIYSIEEYFGADRDVAPWAFQAEDGQVVPGHPIHVPFEGFLAKDGRWLIINAITDRLWGDFCRASGLEHLVADPRFATASLRTKNRIELRSMLRKVFLSENRDYWVDIFEKSGVPCAPVNTSSEALHHPQVAARQMLVDVDVGGRKVTVVGNPVKLLNHTLRRFTPAPRLGEHTNQSWG